MNDIVRICIVGACGKMGQAIIAVLNNEKPFDGAFQYITVDKKGKADYSTIAGIKRPVVDVVIDFTNPTTTLYSAKWCAHHGVPLVTGTTGLSEKQLNELEFLTKAQHCPILWSANMSLGVNLLNSLLPQIMGVLEDYDVEIAETHHRDKPDSPSGTAKKFAELLAGVSGRKVVCSQTVESKAEIGVHSFRGGSVSGENSVTFFHGHERLIIEHRVGSEEVFARGAVAAAEWLIDKPPGFYGMNNVFGF